LSPIGSTLGLLRHSAPCPDRKKIQRDTAQGLSLNFDSIFWILEHSEGAIKSFYHHTLIALRKELEKRRFEP
jgi:hypothetical protein